MTISKKQTVHESLPSPIPDPKSDPDWPVYERMLYDDMCEFRAIIAERFPNNPYAQAIARRLRSKLWMHRMRRKLRLRRRK